MAFVGEGANLDKAKDIYNHKIKEYFMVGQEFHIMEFPTEAQLDDYMVDPLLSFEYGQICLALVLDGWD